MTTQELFGTHKLSFYGIFTKSNIKKICKSFLFLLSILAFALCFIYLLFFNKHEYIFLVKLTNNILGILPALLGFCVGGYAIFVALSTDKTIFQKISNQQYFSNKQSLYQTTSGLFAFFIIVQTFTLIFSYIISVIISLEISLSIEMDRYLNIFTASSLCSLCLYSIGVICYVAINIFTLGQVAHFLIVKEKNENKDASLERYDNVLLKLKQIQDDINDKKDTKGIIEKIDKRELAVVFPPNIKDKIINITDNPFHYLYLVNVDYYATENIYVIVDLLDKRAIEVQNIFEK